MVSKEKIKKGLKVLSKYVSIEQFRWVIGGLSGVFILMMGGLFWFCHAQDSAIVNKQESNYKEMRDLIQEQTILTNKMVVKQTESNGMLLAAIAKLEQSVQSLSK